MKKIILSVRRIIVWLVITLIYMLGCLCYDKEYLTGRHFDRWHFTKGWKWILQYWFGQKVMKKNGHVPWPVPPHVCIAVPQNIIFDPDDMQNFHTTGNYFQGNGAKVIIGKGCSLGPNTGYITSNHDFTDIHTSQPGLDVVLGESCWVGMNAVLLPGVCLGNNTMVGAGSVVTKSFPEGNCIIAGNPARKIKDLPV